MTHPTAKLPTLMPDLVPSREPWPEIDQLTANTTVRNPIYTGWYPPVKAAMDGVLAALLLPIAAVVVALAALAIKLTSPGPVFYTQTRVGLLGRRFRIIKLRTMYHNCEALTGAQWSQKGDKRVTPVGRILRLLHIDELPQLWNVLRGEMSLVGPRPERPEVIQAKGLDRLVPGYRHRLLVKPGVTGLAQVQLPADTDITSVRYKVVYDLYYIENQSPWLDLRLMLATLFKAVLGPKWLRRVFGLPSRATVAAAFCGHVAPSATADPLSGLLPA